MSMHTLVDDLSIPDFLDRRKHPELNQSPETIKAAEAAEAKQRQEISAHETLKKQISATQRKLAAILRRGEPTPQSIPGKIAAGYRKKLARLINPAPFRA